MHFRKQIVNDRLPSPAKFRLFGTLVQKLRVVLKVIQQHFADVTDCLINAPENLVSLHAITNH